MISFTTEEILASILYSLGYGALFFVLISALRLLLSIVSAIPTIVKKQIVFSKVLPLPDFKECIKPRGVGGVFLFLSIIAFSLGFVTISYISLDGMIRIYMLILSFAAFYLLNSAFFNFLSRIYICILNLGLRIMTLILRVVFYPIFYLIHKKVKS